MVTALALRKVIHLANAVYYNAVHPSNISLLKALECKTLLMGDAATINVIHLNLK